MLWYFICYIILISFFKLIYYYFLFMHTYVMLHFFLSLLYHFTPSRGVFKNFKKRPQNRTQPTCGVETKLKKKNESIPQLQVEGYNKDKKFVTF